MRCSSFYKHGHGEYVRRIHSCRVLEEERGVQMAGELGSTRGTASLCKASETLPCRKTSDVEDGETPALV